MTDRRRETWLPRVAYPGVVFAVSLIPGGGELVALPIATQAPLAPPHLLIEDGSDAGAGLQSEPSASAGREPLAELHEALAAARAKLEQLNQAAAALAGAAALREQLTTVEDENRQMAAELQSLRASRADWQRSDEAAKARLAELVVSADEAAAEAKRLDQELAGLRWQNAQLTTNLSRAEAARDGALAETETVRAELHKVTEGVDAERARQREQLAATAERLNDANAALIAAEQERDSALGQLDARADDADQLSEQLAVAEAQLHDLREQNRNLETRLAGLELAASAATDVAKQNLLAVESQIEALNSTLATVELGQEELLGMHGGQEVAPGSVAEASSEATAPDADVLDAAALDRAGLDQAPAAGPPQPEDAEIALIKLSDPAERAGPRSLAAVTADLPMESRIQAESLLADLEAETGAQGVTMVVPGAELFTVNSDEVRPAAHDSLAKVAELINLYKDQPVLIVGHTDAVGASDYNKTLSERRASLIKQFFVDHFDVDGARLSTRGLGEERPITSNATAAGRRANRRVEVLILD
jgi:outer membrane protein OmpA-like peptidoglycan-associated protein